jgi:orotidine-5'-phosphate decarboxylase
MYGRKFVERYLKLSRIKNSILCVGIDPVTAEMRDRFTIPMSFVMARGEIDGIREFCINVIEKVTPFAPIIKPNAQFIVYLLGFDGLKDIVEKIHDGNSLALLDIKLSDIGSTIDAGLFWIDKLGFDAVTFSPFPGYQNGVDSVYKWADEKEKGIFALCRMSNPGTHDYQSRKMDGEKFYKRLARDAFEHGSNGFVVGCTANEELKEIRGIIGENPLILSPGLGPQGGDPMTALRYGTNSNGEGLIVSSSRGVNYAYESFNWEFGRYAEAAGIMAAKKRDELNSIREKLGND